MSCSKRAPRARSSSWTTGRPTTRPEIVERYADAGVRHVLRERGGISAAGNAGLLESRGDLIAFLDGDDGWLPDKLALQLEHLHRHPSAGLVTGGEWLVFEDGRRDGGTTGRRWGRGYWGTRS